MTVKARRLALGLASLGPLCLIERVGCPRASLGSQKNRECYVSVTSDTFRRKLLLVMCASKL